MQRAHVLWSQTLWSRSARLPMLLRNGLRSPAPQPVQTRPISKEPRLTTQCASGALPPGEGLHLADTWAACWPAACDLSRPRIRSFGRNSTRTQSSITVPACCPLVESGSRCCERHHTLRALRGGIHTGTSEVHYSTRSTEEHTCTGVCATACKAQNGTEDADDRGCYQACRGKACYVSKHLHTKQMARTNGGRESICERRGRDSAGIARKISK